MPKRIQGHKARQPAAPVPMPDQTPISITHLAAEAIEVAAARRDGQWRLSVTREIHAFVEACSDADIIEVPDERLSEVAQQFAERATASSVAASERTRSARRTAVRSLLKLAAKRGVLVFDPFASNYDRVLAGEAFPIELKVRGYLPLDLPAAPWNRVRPVFEKWVPKAITADAGLAYGAVTTHLSRHLIWCDASGIPLDARRALEPNVIDRALRSNKQSKEGSKSAARSILIRVGQALGPQAHPLPLKRTGRLAPYNEEEQEAIVRWLLAIPPEKAAAGLWPVVVFGLGVGFDVPAMRWLRGTHVSRRGQFVVVHDATERIHPVAFLPQWEDEGLRLAEKAGDGFLIHPSIRNRAVKDLVCSLIALAGPPPPGTPRLDTRRLRSTWIVGHMQRGVSPVVLLGAAALDNWSALDSYADFVDWPGDDEAFRLLRGED